MRSGAASAVGGRVELREATDEERAALGWEAGSDILTIARPSEADPVGAIAFTIAADTLTVWRMEIVSLLRGRGLGAEAVRLLEAAAVSRGVRRFRALVPASLGLALYFWLRLGYRPARPGDREWHRHGQRDIIAMIRQP